MTFNPLNAKKATLAVPSHKDLHKINATDCLRVLSRTANPLPYLHATQKIQRWSAAFDYEDIDQVIAAMNSYNVFATSLLRYKPLTPE